MEKIKISTETSHIDDFVETSKNYIHLLLPNGDRYRLCYDSLYRGLEIMKTESDTNSHISIVPGVSNKITLI